MIGQKITILGAGIAGLSAALALSLRGARVTVLEQAEEIREVGAGIQISPNGFAVLNALGVGGELKARAVRAQAVELRDYRAGRQVMRVDLTKLPEGQDYFFVHRSDLVEVLAAAARAAGARIRLLQQVESIEDHGAAGFCVRTALGGEHCAPILLGADGVHSRVRSFLNGPAAPFFTGQVAWRATIPAAPPITERRVRVYMGPRRHVVMYPLRGGQLMNVVAVQERAAWTAESWTQEDTPENLAAAFADFTGEVRDWLGRIEQVHQWGLFRHPVAQTWYRGNAAILGDAAHPTLPFLAQGACMALEDAWVLAECLAGAEAPEQGFAAYHAKRIKRVPRVIEAANRNAFRYHLSFPPLRLAAHTALRLAGTLAPGAAVKQFDWLYGLDVTAAG
ncbi:FAD-dependent oxidoreductase [Pseudoruegeria aquimaris]|uniref:FAD-dependent oxidoreductase n=1 Tax=Pseudoruegeria aquimaris TaxID=393663 RepID=UPI00111BDD64|nr:FAD-dependent oxidoreductase [Pseudoruegeria aquimaris]